MSAQRFALALLLTFVLLAPGPISSQRVQAQPDPAPPAPAGSMLFIENAGQWPEAARFQVWGSPLGAGTTWLAEDAIWLVVSTQVDKEEVDKEESRRCADPLVYLPTCLPVHSSHALKLTFPGSNPDVRIEPLDPLTATVSYFIGSDPTQWRADVPVWGGVRYVDLYPGVDLVIGGASNGWQLEAAPGAGVEGIRVQIEGANLSGIDGTTLQLVVDGDASFVTLPSAAFSYEILELSAHHELVSPAVHPRVREEQPATPTDDPADLLYSTFLGGSDSDWGRAVTVDQEGNAYVAGLTYSTDFPTTPGVSYPMHNGQMDIFVVKLHPTGSGLVYATFLGGSLWDYGYGIAVDGTGSVYVTGTTYSTNFPSTPDAFDTSFNGSGSYGGDAFVVKLNPSGSGLVYATFLGGWNSDSGFAIVVNEAHHAYVTGATGSINFPTTPGAFDRTYNGGTCGGRPCSDVFLAELNSSGSGLIYATFLGADAWEEGWAIGLDGMGNVYATGFTTSTNFPTSPHAYDTSYNGESDAFVVRLNPASSQLAYGTLLGGGHHDHGYGIAVDSAGNAYITGQTRSDDFPSTPAAFDVSYNGGICGDLPCSDAFVVKLNPDGNELAFATFLGGGDGDNGRAIDVDQAGNTFITGETASSDFPTTPGAFDTSFNGYSDAYVVQLDPAGSHLVYSTFLGGGSSDKGYGVVSNEPNSVYVFGDTFSSDFPVTANAVDTSYNGGSSGGDTFMSALSLAPYSSNTIAPIEQPNAGALVSGAVTLRGFAIDLGSAAGTGIDAVHIYLDGPNGTGTIIGGATYGLDRPDVAAQYGARFGPSGWELSWDTAGVAPGVHRLYLYAHRTTDNTWSLMEPHLVVVRGGRLIWLPLVSRH